ncbi:flagellar basal-body rod protein FlgF [Pseudoduganella ginsengisoli]|uniref:Flagellar hook-basal body complex protein n=1 Tax=Pseudoduganella ginsengisoli TaxID=1462440 RepID=A0A6L6Q946_9BURK|nr:flagellar hook-basal body protein [Pseudoduganella ginsengisoli]MTW05956.1 flagellar hook-basal body complex protein [Pseudoduganella ginsengisoli]
MPNALATAAVSMQNDMRYMQTVAQNMANIATPGYKRAIPVAQAFDAALMAAAPGPQQATPGAVPELPQPPVSSVPDLSAGAVKQTGRLWDLAITGDGYFELATPEGPAYTRAGDFRLDGQGRLVSQHGYPVQGLDGPLQLNGSAAVAIGHDGRITQDGAAVGQIKLVRFADTRALHKNGAGLLQGAEGTPDPRPELQSGYLENSNVSPLREMVAMMETTRRFEAAQKLYQGYDEALGSAIQKLGQF